MLVYFFLFPILIANAVLFDVNLDLFYPSLSLSLSLFRTIERMNKYYASFCRCSSSSLSLLIRICIGNTSRQFVSSRYLFLSLSFEWLNECKSITSPVVVDDLLLLLGISIGGGSDGSGGANTSLFMTMMDLSVNYHYSFFFFFYTSTTLLLLFLLLRFLLLLLLTASRWQLHQLPSLLSFSLRSLSRRTSNVSCTRSINDK